MMVLVGIPQMRVWGCSNKAGASADSKEGSQLRLLDHRDCLAKSMKSVETVLDPGKERLLNE